MTELFVVNDPAVNNYLENISKRENSKRIQLFPKWKQLLPTVRTTQRISIAWKPYWQQATSRWGETLEEGKLQTLNI
ncbi:MAG: hypothetical protein KUL83_05495 [Lentimicrobium sp.]|nr:hypothetical protein [Lentimicrobium sp.]MDD4597497.1 hypothetical protein [Lentimicrobiaceae bacterium]MDY0025433.1 hypothetical protein [Lentimicrobium sp.]